jgi:hypothetical protein
MAEIVTTDEFANWFANLDDPGRMAVTHVVELLARQGLSLERRTHLLCRERNMPCENCARSGAAN